MVEFITKGYEPRKKTETQVESSSQQIAVLSGQRRAGHQVWRICRSFSIVLFSLIYLAHRKKDKKGEELLNAKGRDMPFLKLAMSKMSSIIPAVIVNFAFLKPR